MSEVKEEMEERKILKVDLSKRSCEIEELPDSVLRKYIGGRGLGAYLLSREVSRGIDPLGAENHLIFAAGPGNGTGLSFCNKSAVITKSPLTGIYLYTISSGMFCHQLRKAGFWAVDISGVADTPVYLNIQNEKVEFCDAESLWGMETGKAQEVMIGGLSRNKAATVAIGPAGERMLVYAAIMADGSTYRAFGRGGSGAVMGSKRLKGIVVAGDRVVAPVDKEGFNAVKRLIKDNIKANSKWVAMRRRYGTGGDNIQMSELGMVPTRNWQGGQFEGIEGICPATTAEEWPRDDIACAPFCPAPCSHYIEIRKGTYLGAHCDGPEYETMYSFGSACGIDKFDAVVAANQICDENGLDTMSVGLTMSFAMECFEKGLITLKDTGGIELRFGNDEAMIAMLKKIVSGEDFGRRLALGARRLSQEIPGSEAFAMHAKGMELGGYECRGLTGQALQFAVSPVGGSHHAFGLPARKEAFDGTRMDVEGKGEYVKNMAIGRIIRDSVIMCSFPGMIVTDAMLPDIVSCLFGESWTADDIKQAGVRIMCEERLFNMREGLTREDDTLPSRLLNEPKPDGPTRGAVVPLEELKDDFYRAMGWDLASGNPPDSLLDELGIKR